MIFTPGEKVWVCVGPKLTTHVQAIVIKDPGSSRVEVKIGIYAANSFILRDHIRRPEKRKSPDGTVVLTQEEIDYCRKRFQEKHYTLATCIPMSPRQVYEIEQHLEFDRKHKKASEE